MNLEHAPNPRGEAVAMVRDVDSTMKNDHGVFWQASIERLSKMVKVSRRQAGDQSTARRCRSDAARAWQERVPQSRQSLQVRADRALEPCPAAPRRPRERLPSPR